MKALILNSGLGSRMGAMTNARPKCMTMLSEDTTILSRQLKLCAKAGIGEVVMTTGYQEDLLKAYVKTLGLPLRYTFVTNPRYRTTNYIYSIYLARDYVEDTILLLHGDLVFSEDVLSQVLASPESCVAVSSTRPLPEKDFKAVARGGFIHKIGVDVFHEALAAQPLYKLRWDSWALWLGQIRAFVEAGLTDCYAEDALNAVLGQVGLRPVDIGENLCMEVDTLSDLRRITGQLVLSWKEG